MEQFFVLFTSVDPLAALITVIIGAVWAYLFRNYDFDKSTVLLIGGFYVPLLVSRILYAITYGLTGQGFLGYIYITIYMVGAYVARLYFRRNLRKRDKHVEEIIKQLDSHPRDKV